MFFVSIYIKLLEHLCEPKVSTFIYPIDNTKSIVYYDSVDKKIKSLSAQYRWGTLERNTEIALRALGGESQVALAKEFGVTKQMVNKIVKRYEKLHSPLREATE